MEGESAASMDPDFDNKAYQILIADDYPDFERRMNTLVKRGWVPVPMPHGNYGWSRNFQQALYLPMHQQVVRKITK